MRVAGNYWRERPAVEDQLRSPGYSRPTLQRSLGCVRSSTSSSVHRSPVRSTVSTPTDCSATISMLTSFVTSTTGSSTSKVFNTAVAAFWIRPVDALMPARASGGTTGPARNVPKGVVAGVHAECRADDVGGRFGFELLEPPPPADLQRVRDLLALACGDGDPDPEIGRSSARPFRRVRSHRSSASCHAARTRTSPRC